MEQNNLKAEWMEFVRNRWIAGVLAQEDGNDDSQAANGDGAPVTSEYLCSEGLFEEKLNLKIMNRFLLLLLFLLVRPAYPRILAWM